MNLKWDLKSKQWKKERQREREKKDTVKNLPTQKVFNTEEREDSKRKSQWEEENWLIDLIEWSSVSCWRGETNKLLSPTQPPKKSHRSFLNPNFHIFQPFSMGQNWNHYNHNDEKTSAKTTHHFDNLRLCPLTIIYSKIEEITSTEKGLAAGSHCFHQHHKWHPRKSHWKNRVFQETTKNSMISWLFVK